MGHKAGQKGTPCQHGVQKNRNTFGYPTDSTPQRTKNARMKYYTVRTVIDLAHTGIIIHIGCGILAHKFTE